MRFNCLTAKRDRHEREIAMFYKDELNRMIKELRERRDDLLGELKTLPEGEFMCTEQDGLKRYFQRLPASGNRKKERRYGIKRKPEVLNGLVRKEYVTRALRTIDKDIRALEFAAGRYRPSDENTLMEGFVSKHPELAGSIYSSGVNVEEWKSEYGRIDGYFPDSLIQTAADGTRMRSKNEVYIASRLDHYGLTYRSDCPAGIRGLNRAPDFTILRKRDGKIIYWEHMGMMDDLEYRIDNKRKLEEYEEAGIVPWDNLIVTYDTIDGGLRADLVEAMIQSWLL